MTAALKQFIDALPADRQLAFARLRDCVVNGIPEGFEESFSENSLNYTVPHVLHLMATTAIRHFPCHLSASPHKKKAITLHHMGLYADPNLLSWFSSQYAEQVSTKLDMGKGCVRFKKFELIAYQLLSELMAKISIAQWIAIYEVRIKR